MTYRTLNPTTGELLETFETQSDEDVAESLELAVAGFRKWRLRPLRERGASVLEVAARLEERSETLARLMAVEMGKPIAQGRAEIAKCVSVCRYYADKAESLLTSDSRESDASDSYVRYDPIGVVVAIMPWNFPFWQVFRAIVPALMAGNVIILKHAPNTPQCALAIAALMTDAGFPDEVYQSLFLTNEQAATLVSHPRVQGVTVTGSELTGRAVGAIAGGSLTRAVMELGGNDPFIVFADADVAEAVDVAVMSRCLNSGQSCIAAKRFFVQREIYSEFTEAFVAAMKRQVVGDPLEDGTEIGPLARGDLRDALHAQVVESESQGAELLTGGSAVDGPGFFYPPTVMAEAPLSAPISHDETFGPVASLTRFDLENEAIALANAPRFGLGASVWTADATLARRMTERLDFGAVFVNGLVKSDPRLPFGGSKASGYGRELGAEGILEFVNRKTVWIR